MWRIITVTWGTLTIQIGWPIATQPAVEHGSGQKSSFSACWTWPLSTVTSFYLHVVGGKFHTEIFDSPLSERCWHILGMSHDHPCLLEDQPKRLLTLEDWTRHNKHWPARNPTQQRRVCSARGMTRSVKVKCDMALCVDRNCFADYHTKDNL